MLFILFLLFVIRSLFESDCRSAKSFCFHNKNVILSSIYKYIILTSHGLPICFCWDGFHTVLGQRFFSISASQRVRFYCEFRPSSGHVIKLLPGSKLYLADQCLDCSCTTDGLQCCGQVDQTFSCSSPSTVHQIVLLVNQNSWVLNFEDLSFCLSWSNFQAADNVF